MYPKIRVCMPLRAANPKTIRFRAQFCCLMMIKMLSDGFSTPFKRSTLHENPQYLRI